MIDSIIAKTMEYLSVPAVVGYEHFFMDFLESDFQKRGLTVYRHERYLVVSGQDPLSAILCAHIDRHGLISLGDDEYVYAAQYMKEIKYGENNRLARQQLESIAKRFESEEIFAYDPETNDKIGFGVIQTCNPSMLDGDALFSIQDMETMDHGVPLAYGRTARVEGNYFKGQIDNAISLGVISELFAQGFEGTAILTTEEEIGKSWIHIKTYLNMQNIKANGLIIIDTSPFSDAEPIEQGHIIFRSRDMSAEFNAALVQDLKERATQMGFPYQVKDQVLLASGKTVDQLGSTELGKVIKNTNGRWSGATIQIPTLMYHTSNETTTTKAIDNFSGFLRSILIDDKIQSLRAEAEAK